VAVGVPVVAASAADMRAAACSCSADTALAAFAPPLVGAEAGHAASAVPAAAARIRSAAAAAAACIHAAAECIHAAAACIHGAAAAEVVLGAGVPPAGRAAGQAVCIRRQWGDHMPVRHTCFRAPWSRHCLANW